MFFFSSHSCSCYNRTGGALKTPIALESLKEISIEDTVHDAPDNATDPTMSDMPTFSEAAKVVVEDDIIGHPASIAYHDSLRQLAEYLLLPVSVCPAKDPNSNVKCQAPGPFEINIRSRGTSAVIEWVSFYISYKRLFIFCGTCIFFCCYISHIFRSNFNIHKWEELLT